MSVKVRISSSAGAGETLLPIPLFREQETGIISYGQRQAVTFFRPQQPPGAANLAVNKEILGTLGLSAGTKLRAVWHEDGTNLRLGPVVAILAWRYRSLPMSYLFGPATDMARMFVRLARARGAVAYAFSPQDIDWDTGSTIGYVPKGKGWRRVRVPLPHVVYDRIQSRAIDASRRVQNAKRRLMSMPDLHYFNPCFLDKWETHQALAADPLALRYLPQTERLTNLGQIGPWLRRYNTVFIKPSRGSLGLGIIKITREGRGFRYRRVRLGGGTRAGSCASLARLEEVLRKLLSKRSMIIQQGLSLARYAGRPYDIRIIVQKTPRGNWVCTNMIARVASPSSAVSNVAEGGSMIPVRRAIRSSLKINSKATVRRLRRAARVVARALEANLEQEFGELGIDVALDRRGRFWLIEANAKPGRQSDAQPGIPPSMRRVARYAVAKARFAGR